MVQHLKEKIRKEMLAKRDALAPDELRSRSSLIEDLLFSRPRFSESRTVAFYLHKGNEVDTTSMIRRALAEGKEVLVPVTDHKITLFRFDSFEGLVSGKYGIREPERKALPSKEPDVIVVPGVSFGLCMHRLGYGKGYYDRFLSTCPAYRVGVCFDFQVVERLPVHEDDERMDEIITEKRVITL